MMASKVIAICGTGPGVSIATAERFGKEGFKVALLARTKSKLDTYAAGLHAKGIEAQGFPVDLSDPDAVKVTLTEVMTTMGPVTVLLWNLYPPVFTPYNILTIPVENLQKVNNLAITGPIIAAQTIAPGFEQQQGQCAIFVTNGWLKHFSEDADNLAVAWGTPGLAIFGAAKHKTVRLLKAFLKAKNVYVGEITVNATVKGTAFDFEGKATFEASTIASKYWELYTNRPEPSFVSVPDTVQGS